MARLFKQKTDVVEVSPARHHLRECKEGPEPRHHIQALACSAHQQMRDILRLQRAGMVAENEQI